MASYHGKVLHIDLSTQTSRVEDLPPSYLRHYLGGAGLAVRLLYEHAPPNVDPLSPANPLVFAPGALTGTMVPTSSKHAVATKSPLTGFVGDSLSSSAWSLALKRAGYDALVITGATPSLTYVFIDNHRVHYRKASHLSGKGSGETEEAIRREVGDERVRVSSIGLGGEKLVRYACITNDLHRQAGRTGVGTVMGSKNLKAVAVRGTLPIRVAHLQELEAVCLDLFRKSQGAATEKYRILGTPANVLVLHRLAALPTRNFQQSTFEGAEQVSGELLHQHYLAKIAACVACPIACEHLYRVADGLYAGSQVQLDYETLYALGPLCGIDHPPAILKAAQLCDDYGLDTISTGGSIAWAMECFQKGLITKDDTQGLDLSFGNHATLVEMVHRIGQRQGLGDLLAEGVRRAAATLGQGSDRWAMHIKGLELPGYEPRSLKTLALGLAVGTRGGCHNRSSAYEPDMSAKVDRLKAEEGRGILAMETEDFSAVLDSLIICKFLRGCFTDFYPQAARIFQLATGLDITTGELKQAGERITNLKKAFNIREGWTQSDDWLPPRVMQEPLPTGVAQGSLVSEEELRLMIADYYRARGWTPEGLIPGEKLRELGLQDIAQRVEVIADGLHRL